MGFFSSLRRVAHKVSHPAETFKAIKKVVKKAEKSVGKAVRKTAHFVEKEGGVAIKVAHKGLDFVEDHAKTIKEIVNVTATIVEVIGVATGQPEIVAGAAALQAGANKALDLAAKAAKVVDTAEKVVAVAKAIREKEKVGAILHKTADTLMSAGQINGNKKLMKMAGHIKDGAHVVDAAVDHIRDLHAVASDTISAIEKGDIVGAVGGVVKGVKVVKKVKSDRDMLMGILDKLASANEKQAEALEEEISAPKPVISSTITKKKPKAPKAKKEKKTKPSVAIPPAISEVKAPAKKEKKKRKPSAYNLFVGAKIKEGKTFKEAVALWNEQKKK